jgi:hypothetical protein
MNKNQLRDNYRSWFCLDPALQQKLMVGGHCSVFMVVVPLAGAAKEWCVWDVALLLHKW